jgi:hypothetical protein
MQVAPKKKSKRKLKKGFKIILIIIILTLILTTAFFVTKRYKIFPFNGKVVTDKTEEINNNEKTADPDSLLDPFSKLFKLRLPSQHLVYANSGEVAENGDMKIFLKNTNQDSGYLFVNTKEDPNFVWITFVSAIAGEPLKSSLANDLSHLSYIDLRFKNKIFYKFDNKYTSTINTENSNSTTSTSTR